MNINIKSICGQVLYSSDKLTLIEAVIEAIKSGADLSGADLSDANLRSADLSGANLRSADLSGANLSGANLSGANFRSANLRSADLRSANLRSADLSGADLSGANLSGADLSGANLSGADLRNADLSGADLRNANLSGADLRNANLRSADLRNANLSGADLRNANLSGATLLKILAQTRITPEEGSFIAWKRLEFGIIAKLEIPVEAKRVGGPVGRKCRASHATVLELIYPEGDTAKHARSIHDSTFIYTVGAKYHITNFEENAFIECAPGIHFFMSRYEAEQYK